MALKTCRECGHALSNKADKCPGCGAPQKHDRLGWIALILISALVVFLIVALQ